MEILDVYSGDYWSPIWRILISVMDISDLRSGDSWSPKFCKKDPPSHTCPPLCPPPYTDKKEKKKRKQLMKKKTKMTRNTPAARPKKFLSWKIENMKKKSCVYLCPTHLEEFHFKRPWKKKRTKNQLKHQKQKCEKKQTNYSMWTA